MKKLLGLLSTLTISSGTIPITTFNNSLLKASQSSNYHKHKHLKTIITKDKDQIKCISVDSNDNIYFGTQHINQEKGSLYKTVDQGKTITKIVNWLQDVDYSFVDKKDNVYFGSDNDFYVLKKNTTKPILINGFLIRRNEFIIDSKNNIYFLKSDEKNENQIYVLKNDTTVIQKTDFNINGISKIAIDKNDNIYYASRNNGLNEHIYFIANGEKTAKEIAIIPYGLVNAILLDNQNNIFIGTSFYTYQYDINEKILKKIDRLNGADFIVDDTENNIYFASYQSNKWYMLKQKQISKRIPIAKNIETLEAGKQISYVTNNNNIYICANDICYSNVYKLV